MPRKSPKFFCEFCGTEVKRNDKFCPSCGKFFAAVKCPSCGLTGQAPVFVKGCPSCGYAVFSSSSSSVDPGFSDEKSGAGKFLRKKKQRHEAGGIDPLPLWVYFFILLLAAVLIAVILFFPF